MSKKTKQLKKQIRELESQVDLLEESMDHGFAVADLVLGGFRQGWLETQIAARSVLNLAINNLDPSIEYPSIGILYNVLQDNPVPSTDDALLDFYEKLIATEIWIDEVGSVSLEEVANGGTLTGEELAEVYGLTEVITGVDSFGVPDLDGCGV